MKRRMLSFMWLVLLASLLLSGCGAPPAEAPAIDVTEESDAAPVEVTEEAPEPTAEATAIPEADLDGAFTAFIGNLEGYNVIEPKALNEIMAEEPPFIIDARYPDELSSEEGYTGYIEGAVVIPLRELAQNTDKLPSFDTPIVIYCKTGHRSTIAMTALNTLGWTDVKTMKGGIHGWIDAELPVAEGAPEEAEALNAETPDPVLLAELDTMLANIPEGWGVVEPAGLVETMAESSDTVVIDVRRPEEIAETGVVEGAVSIPLETFIELEDQWPADLNTPIVVYCKTGIRSAMAEAILWTYGYTDILSLKGGLTAWQAAGNPTVGGLNNAVTTFISSMQGYNFTDPAALNEMMAEEPPFIVDARNPEELSAEEGYTGYIDGALVIPLRELAQNVDKLPSFDTPIVVYCKTGHRSTIAMTALSVMGWTNVRSLKGGIHGWIDAGLPVVEGTPDEAETLNAVEVDPTLVGQMDAMLSNIPDGWAITTPEDLVETLAENSDIILLDVRTAEEVDATGTIEGALTIPLEELLARRAEWPADKEATIVVFCKVGGRGAIALSILRSYGYSNVINLKGGIDAWIAAGNPVVAIAQ